MVTDFSLWTQSNLEGKGESQVYTGHCNFVWFISSHQTTYYSNISMCSHVISLADSKLAQYRGERGGRGGRGGEGGEGGEGRGGEGREGEGREGHRFLPGMWFRCPPDPGWREVEPH